MHPVERKLRREICPYVAMVEHLRRSRRLKVYSVYMYVGDIAALLGGFGIAPEVMRFINSESASPAQQASAGALSGSLGWIGVVLLLGWGMMKIYVKRSRLDEHYQLITSSYERIIDLYGDVRTALRTPDPMQQLNDAQTGMESTENLCVVKKAWPVNANTAMVQADVDRMVDDLVDTYGQYWTAAPSSQQQGGRA